MPADVLAQASACGSVSGIKEEEGDDLFDRSEEAEGVFEPSLKGGVKGARKQQESIAAAAALARNLSSPKAKALLPQLGAANEVFVPEPEPEEAKKVKKAKAKVVAAEPEPEAEPAPFMFWEASPEPAPFKPTAIKKIATSWEEDADGIDIDAI
jgi:hypothetical protein